MIRVSSAVFCPDYDLEIQFRDSQGVTVLTPLPGSKLYKELKSRCLTSMNEQNKDRISLLSWWKEDTVMPLCVAMTTNMGAMFIYPDESSNLHAFCYDQLAEFMNQCEESDWMFELRVCLLQKTGAGLAKIVLSNFDEAKNALWAHWHDILDPPDVATDGIPSSRGVVVGTEELVVTVIPYQKSSLLAECFHTTPTVVEPEPEIKSPEPDDKTDSEQTASEFSEEEEEINTPVCKSCRKTLSDPKKAFCLPCFRKLPKCKNYRCTMKAFNTESGLCQYCHPCVGKGCNNFTGTPFGTCRYCEEVERPCWQCKVTPTTWRSGLCSDCFFATEKACENAPECSNSTYRGRSLCSDCYHAQ